jgi:CheY-like chemotaxis protein
MATDSQFRRRILLVDGDASFLRVSAEALRTEGYEVLTAQNGFEALYILRGAHPELLITELNLPAMSGFELLSVVRTRFSHIAAIAVSSEYTAVTVPHEAICDTFVAKGPNCFFELLEEARRLISESPLRGSRPKTDVAPVWIPRSTAGYIILTCPECLRSFSAAEPTSTSATESCLFCGASVRFEMSSVEEVPTAPQEPLTVRTRKIRERAHAAVIKSRKLRERSDAKFPAE